MLADRKFLVDAAIVKTMKQHRTLLKGELVQRVISALRFPLDSGLLQSRLDQLTRD